MTTLIQQIEEMRIRMNDLATNEQGLVRALGDSLTLADQTLLQEVRCVAAQHEARRGAILNELQTLAARMCTLHEPQEPVGAIEEAVSLTSQKTQTPVVRGVDWRIAAANIQEELGFHLRRRATGT
jgi:hypothetical protein